MIILNSAPIIVVGMFRGSKKNKLNSIYLEMFNIIECFMSILFKWNASELRKIICSFFTYILFFFLLVHHVVVAVQMKQKLKLTWIFDKVSKLIKKRISNKLIYKTGNRFPKSKEVKSSQVNLHLVRCFDNPKLPFGFLFEMFGGLEIDTHHFAKVIQMSLLHFENR